VLKILVTAAALLWSGAALADDGPAKPMRLLGDAPTIGEAGPAHFAIDALLSESEEQGETKVDGWFTALPPLVGSGEVTGKCERKHCELSLKLDNGKLTLTGDLGGLSGPAVGAFAVGDDDGPPVTKGAVTFAPFTDTLPGLGELVKPEAVDSAALADMLLWDGAGPAFGGDDPHVIDSFQREDLANWQQQNNRPMTGLLFTADVDLLARQRASAQKAVAWIKLGGPDQGWSAGYSSTLLPKASRVGREQHFDSADGKASLVIVIDPPLSNAEFYALADRLKNENSGQNYSLAGQDLEIDLKKDGRVGKLIYFSREGGLGRMTYTYPEGENPFGDIALQVIESFKVTDAVKPTP